MFPMKFSVLNKFKGCPNDKQVLLRKRDFFFFTPFFNIKHCLKKYFFLFQGQHFLSSH